MKELNEIDKLIRSSLADYKPVPEKQSKERFLASAARQWESDKGIRLNWKALLLLALLLAIVVGSVYYYLPAGMNKNADITNTVNHDRYLTYPSQAGTPETAVPNNNTKNREPEPNTYDNLSEEPKTNLTTENEANSLIVKATTVINNSDASDAAMEKATATSVPLATREAVSIKNLAPLSLEEISIINTYRAGIIERNFPVLPLPDIKPEEKYQPPLKSNQALHMAYSLYYRPEFVFNIIDNNKIVHNVGADVQFKLFDDKYIIRTGIGTSLSKGYNEYAVLYNEYLGSYEGLDSVTFAWDEQHYHLLPTYYKSEREVFDTAIQTDISRVYKRYTYLQIPLVLGYDFITKANFSLGVRFGPTFSALLSSKTISDDYDPGKHQVIQINQITPDRIQTNWLLMAGLNIGIYSKKKLFYEIEPQFSYYFNSVYQKYDVSKSPYSIGLRLAIGIK